MENGMVDMIHWSGRRWQKSGVEFQKTSQRLFRTIILPVVLYECETWSLTLREEHRQRVFEIRVLRRLFGPKRNEVLGD
jgi:hypothetical protein